MKIFGTLCIGLMVGGLIVIFLYPYVADFGPAFSIPVQRAQYLNYTFINPLLECDESTFSSLSRGTIEELDTELRAHVNSLQDQGTLIDGAIYFRELGGGPVMSINEDIYFTPGSLLKVPLVLSIYKEAERDPDILSKKIIYDGSDLGYEEYFTTQQIEEDKTYTIEDLVEATLIHSDNNAALLLSQIISNDRLNAAYKNLGIREPALGYDYEMTVQTYASFFRILYNGTYLEHDLSERLLEVLSQTTFNKGIVAGVPAGVTVSHKFGERSVSSGLVQLHDCGIVYTPDNPYILCVMMRGTNFETLAREIATISSIVYDKVK